MINGVVISMLAVETVCDLKSRTIAVVPLAVYMVLGIILNCIWGYQSLFSVIGGVLIGLILLGYAFITKESIGYGDGVLFICVGLYVGLSQNLRLLFFSLLLAAVAGGIYTLVKKKSIKTKIPFVPCITFSYVFMTIVEVIK